MRVPSGRAPGPDAAPLMPLPDAELLCLCVAAEISGLRWSFSDLTPRTTLLLQLHAAIR